MFGVYLSGVATPGVDLNHRSTREFIHENLKGFSIGVNTKPRQAEIHRTSDIDEETSQCPVNVVKKPDKMSCVFNVQPLKL